MSLPKIGDIMIYRGAWAEVTEINDDGYDVPIYYGIWSDDNKEQALEATDFYMTQMLVLLRKKYGTVRFTK